MQSSAGVTLRAFLILGCAVGVPAIALMGTSWSECFKKFQKLEIPAILNPASASTPAVTSEPSQAAPPSLAVTLPERSPTVLPGPSLDTNSTGNSGLPTGVHEIEIKLRQFGATYYVLEAWGSEGQLYRFFCKMAVGGDADFTHCFEATDADPLQAMRQVLQQIEAWRDGEGLSTAPSRA
jgi:hypothetical protein